MTQLAGFGRVDITPPVGVELAGFGPLLRRRSTRVHDRIHARALAVQGPTGQWLVVSCDLLGVSAELVEQVRDRVCSETGWHPSEIMVHATHSHAGPATVTGMIGWGEPHPPYLAQLPGLVARACLQAVADLREATVGHCESPLTGFAHDRMRPDRGLTNELALSGGWAEPEPERIDPGVHVIRFDGPEGLRGFVASYSCHPVICCEQTSAIHGDYPGMALRLLEERHPGATGVFLQGAGGDINPLYAHGPEAESFAALDTFSGAFAESVEKGLGNANPLQVDQVRSFLAEVDYDLGPVDPAGLRVRRNDAAALADRADPDAPTEEQRMAAVVATSLTRTIAQLESGQEVRRPVHVHALALGPLRLVGFDLEVFHGIKRRLQARHGEHCLVLSTTNGYLGYAPTAEAYATDADPYPAYVVPLLVGHPPFRPRFEDDLVAAADTALETLADAADDPAARPPAAWWRGAVVYECHLPSLKDGNGDGVGDLAGLVDSLDYLRGTLGVDAIWTGPFFASPLLDQGFDVADHTAVEPVFGTMEIFDDLLAQAHARGVRVLVDYIPNHTSDRHPWFIESRSSRTNPRRDWYVWRDGRPDGGPPNNWTSEAGGSAWELDEPTGQYYLHSHLAEQPDLDWRNPEVRAALLEVLRFWLDRGVDGLRIDVAHMLMKDPELRDNPPAPVAGGNPFDLQHPDFGTQLHVHDRRHPDTFAALAEIRDVVDEYPPAVTIAEIEAMEWPDWAAYYGPDLDGMHLPFPFRLLETPWAANALLAELRGLYAALPADAWPIVALGNHDRSRLATRLGKPQARVAAVLLLTLAATPCLLYGDELGLVDQPVPPERQRDLFARSTGGISRDPVRTPMPWNDEPNAGFSSAPEADLWLPVARDAASVNVEAQLRDPHSFLSLYRRLCALRRERPALRSGAIELGSTAAADDGLLCYERRQDAERLLVALNLTDQPRQLAASAGTTLLSTGDRQPGAGTGPVIHLAPDEALVVDITRGRTP